MSCHRRTMLATMLSLFVAVSASDAHEIKFGHLTITHPWCRQSPDGVLGFMKITNNGSEDDRLIKVTAEISDQVELTRTNVNAGQASDPKGGIPIPAGATVKIAPDAVRLAFQKVKSQPVPNTEIKGALTFEKAGTLQIDFEVEESQ